MTLEFTSLEISPHCTRYRLGVPIPTGALAREISDDGTARATTTVPPFASIEQSGQSQVLMLLHLDPACHVYGLGASQGAVNKRGKRYRMFAKDQAGYTPELEALYASHPVLFVDGPNPFGMFLDFAGEIYFDIDYTVLDALQVRVVEPNFDLYIFRGSTIAELVGQFLELVGPPCVPPLWAFGFQQSRYSYASAHRVQEIAQGFRNHDIPLDAIHVDIHYMDAYKIFTTHPERFPDFPGLVADCAELDVKLIPIIDPGVKIEEGYHAYESGVKKKVFCTNESGENYPAMVWPGYTHLPDFLNSRVLPWWKECHEELVASGIAGLWNDMNEPAIFFTPDGFRGLRKIVTEAHEYGDFPGGAVDFLNGIMRFWHDERYYSEFYQVLESGERVLHQRVHNLYGASMARATSKILIELRSDERPYVITRSSYIGTHRHAVLWTGDNTSNWEDLTYHLRMLVSCSLVGFFYVGADVGGFESNCNPELLIRWTQVGIFSPLFRNHTILDSRDQEPWLFGEKALHILRDAIKLRYALVPYLYSEFLKSVEENKPYITGLFMHYDTQQSFQTDDQFMIGETMMAAPVREPNARGRYIHLPKHHWLLWTARTYDERICQVLEPGNHFVPVGLNEVPILMKEDRLLVMAAPHRSLKAGQTTHLVVVGLVNATASYTYVEDDGKSLQYKNGKRAELKMTVVRSETGVSLIHSVTEHGWKMSVKKLSLEVFDRAGSRELLEVTL